MKINAKELQFRLLQMMKCFHSICEDNDLKYYIIGGTCIGAIRHKGFITWDDDIDIGMPREDYEKLCALPRSAFPKNLELRFYRNTPNSPFHFIKFVDNTTTLIEGAYLNYVEGLYIDVFPLDGVKDYFHNPFERLRCNYIWFEKVMIFYNSMTEKRENWIKKILIYFAKMKSLQTMHSKIEKHMMKYSYKDSEYVANFYGAWKEKEIYPKDDLGTPTLYDFEDTQFYGPELIDEYLTHVYGDYMRLPPKEKRVFKHNFYYISFTEGFREYLRRKNHN